MERLNTPSPNQKFDLVLKPLLVHGNGEIDAKMLAQIYNFDLDKITEVTELLKSDGFVQVKSFHAPNECRQLAITPEGHLSTLEDRYSEQPPEEKSADITKHTVKFHRFSKQIDILSDRFFWIITTGLFIGSLYLLWHSNY